ncbi:23S rRNA (uracil(1939)-C(5))-methyltransferase RlmD [Roseovarius gaetbuli]|uniref:23S rRNA (Uracil(1939)-C(5))-methyltransferase RlmD n=1 Tax=Roseovarius gaetbuli TaxID=1356575 RepID=A0A1X6YXG9_9RHOB|nr:RsmD family RNA methyltransferase [Roseovarius gaetbuli]SLN33705.1 23S rRNA (uracil(1939)-C(5))-methyltransferase RlmD [Roseovarius gaetbuli]
MSQHKIIRLGHQGDGIAQGPVFAPLTLPGEVVSGTLDGQVLRDVKIDTPSPDRVAPPCRHFKSCGGCQLMHASDDFLAGWKQDVVASALGAHGITAEFAPIHVSPAQSRRRATLTARRTKKGAMAGFHAKGSDVVIEIPDCKLLHPALLGAVPVACDLAVTGASRKNGISVSVTLSLNGLDISVSDGKPLDGPLRIALAALADRHNLARLAWDGEVVVTRHAPDQVFGAARVLPPPGAFLQATAEGEAALLADVQAIVGGAKRIADLFAGSGTFALPLAKNAEVLAVEGSAAMCEALDAGWRKTQGLKSVTTEARDLFRQPLLPDELKRFDAVVIDPPRAGAEAQIAEICRARVPVIAYVSCSPTSFARDAKTLLAEGYTLDRLRVVDQFRWSSHVEMVAGFILNPA